MNFMRSPDGVTIEPASRLSRSHVASAVSWLLVPGPATTATRFFPSVLIETDWISGTRARDSIGMGSRAAAVPASSSKDAVINPVFLLFIDMARTKVGFVEDAYGYAAVPCSLG